MRNYLMAGAALFALAACGETADTNTTEAVETVEVAPEDMTTDAPTEATDAGQTAEARLAAVLAAQPEEVQARYGARHPAETLAFFGVEPGMTVVEALPGGGWYTKILSEYVGSDGKIIGADYALDMWPLFGGFATEEFVEGKKTWPADWSADANAWSETDAPIEAFQFGSLPEEMKGTADAVLFIRALHNMSRFEADGGYLSTGVQDSFDVLKSGGVVGVVQHRAPDTNSDEWAIGSAGYLKESRVIDAFTSAGFVFEGASEINANPADMPTEEDVVWRLPPSLGTSADNEELKAAMMAIGESDRMTLKFRKP